MPETKPERTGWRDLRLSNLHRDWGCCGAVDIDFLLIEYLAGYPKGIIEYKHEASNLAKAVLHRDKYGIAEEMCKGKNTYNALVTLGNMGKIPVMLCAYTDDLSHYSPYPLNTYAQSYVHELRGYSEMDFVQLLHDIRGIKMSPQVIERIRSRN